MSKPSPRKQLKDAQKHIETLQELRGMDQRIIVKLKDDLDKTKQQVSDLHRNKLIPELRMVIESWSRAIQAMDTLTRGLLGQL